MRGADRDDKDNKGRKPVDLVPEISSLSMRQTLIEDLVEPKSIECLMIKTPLKKVNKSFTTIIFMWFLMLSVYSTLTLFVFPCKSTYDQHLTLVYIDKANIILYCYSIFALTFVIHLMLL